EARIDSSRIRRGFLEYADWKNKIHPASGRLAAAPILIDDSSAISIMEIRAKARRFRGDSRYFPMQPVPEDGRAPPPPLGLIVVDYLQLARGTGAVKMTFIKEYTRFENYADDPEPGTWGE